MGGVVTVLFTDLVGSTRLLERLGDDAAEALRREHFSVLRQAVATTGGHEVKSLGDGLMVTFESPLAALSCAVAMQLAVSEHNQRRHGEGLKLRVGIHAGEPVAEEGDYFGTAVVVARRLCDRARGRQILASDLVAGLVGSRGSFRLRPAGRVTLKGLARPVLAVTVDWGPGASRPPGGRRRLPVPPRASVAAKGPKLVGRHDELGLLQAAFDRARREGASCVLVLGEPGVGKTRLASEMLAANRRRAIVLAARAYPLGNTASFGIWAEALERHLRDRSHEEVATLCGGFLDDLAVLLHSVAAVRGVAPDTEPPRLRLLEALTTLVAKLAAERPVAILLDDVHLADASSWETLHYLARNLDSAPVLLIATARPGELATQHLATEVLLGLEQEELLSRLVLSPLPPECVAALAEATLATPPSRRLVEWLSERSQGNPLFTLGLLQALIDEGADLAAPELRALPQSLSERVGARLRVLDQPALATLEVLAILGHRVELSDLVRFSSRPLDRLAEILEQLVRAGLVNEDRSGGVLSYEITHPLVAEAIYAGIGGARQQALHRLVGRALMEAGRLGQAAPHFVCSAEPGDPEAIDALAEAFRQAEERQAYREALTLLGALAELLPSGDKRWLDVFDAMARRAEWVVDHRIEADAVLGIRAMREVEAVLDRLPDSARRAAAKYRLTTFLAYGTGEIEEAARLGRQTLALYEEAGDRAGVLLAANELAWIAGMERDFAAMEEQARAVRRSAEAAKEPAIAMQAGAAIGFAAHFLGRFDEAEGAYRRAAEAAAGAGNQFRLTFIRSILAASLSLEGRLTEAYALLDETRAADPAFRENVVLNWASFVRCLGGDFRGSLAAGLEAAAHSPGHLSRRRGIGTVSAAMAATELGQLDLGDELLARTWAAYDERHWFLMLDVCAWVQAALDRRRGDRSKPLDLLRRTSGHLLKLGVWPWAALVLIDLAEMAVETNNGALAAEAVAGLERTARGTERDLQQALAGIGCACAALVAGEPKEAITSAGESAAVLERLGYQAYHGRALEMLGRSLAAAGDRAGSVAALKGAAEVFSRTGAEWRRDRVVDVLGSLGGRGQRAAGAVRGAGALTRREREVAALAATGLTASEIGARLFISERTVEYHLANAYAKLGIDSKLELVRRAAEFGL